MNKPIITIRRAGPDVSHLQGIRLGAQERMEAARKVTEAASPYLDQLRKWRAASLANAECRVVG